MPISVRCSSCDKKLQVKDELVGKKVKCPACGKVLPIRGEPPATPPTQLASTTPGPPTASGAGKLTSARRYECSECSERFLAADVIKKQGRIICRTCRAEMGKSDAGSEDEYRCPKCHKTEVEVTSPSGLRILRHVLFFFPIMPIFIAVTGGVGLFFSVMIFAVYKGLWPLDDRARCTSCGHSWLELESRQG